MALTFNLPSQIVVQTAAQWAVDATVYSNKRILVTSDEYYGSTDQRKFKIADGAKTWSNLDYMPISQTLAQVLVNGNTTGGGQIESDNGFSQLRVEDSESLLAHYDTGGIGGEIRHNTTKTNLFHSLQIDLDAPTISLPQATVSRIVETDASKNLTYAAKNTGYNLALGTTAGTVLEGNRITQVITNGVTDKAPSEDAVYDALALKLDANNAAVTNARNRKYFAYDNTTYTYTGATGDTILKTILIPGGTMGINSTLELFANFIKSGTAGNPAYLVYIGTSASALSGGSVVQYILPGATSLQSGIWVRLSTKNSQTSINTKGISQVANIPQTSQTIPINNRAFNWASDLYVHIYATGANAADTQGIQDYQMYIDNP